MVCRYFTVDSSSVRAATGAASSYVVKSYEWTRAKRDCQVNCNLGSLRQITPAIVRDRNFICADITAASQARQAAQSRRSCVTGRTAHAAEIGDTAFCV